ncbi:MAG: hypothetical protein AB2421_06475 [Thermotaleaceae bacterium]
MKTNVGFKLAAVSLVGMIISFLILWGFQQYNQYQYNNYMNQMQMNGYQMNGYQINGYGNMPIYQNSMNMQGEWNYQGNMPGMNMSGTPYIQGNMNMGGNANMPANMNMGGNTNMQGYMNNPGYILMK